MAIESNHAAAFNSVLKRLSTDSGLTSDVFGRVLTRLARYAPNPATQAQIARGEMLAVPTAISPTTVSRAVAALEREGLVTRGEAAHASRGRPGGSLELGSARRSVIGIHIAHSRGLITGLYGVLMSLNLTGELSDPVVKTLDGNDGVDGIANDAADVVAELRRCAQNLGADVLGVGLELGAHVAGDEIVESTNTGWGHVALADDVARLVGLPVILENDVNARAVTYIYRHTFLEQDFGLVCVFDEGIGAALVVNGRLYRGSAGGAGEIGHCSAEYPPVAGRSPMEGFAAPCRCGGLGHVEALAAPARIAAELGVLDLTSAASEPLYDDNERVTATASVFRRSGTALGRGLCAMANLTNPGRIHVSLPAVLAMAAPGTAGSAYVDAAEAALNEAYSTAARDARAGAGRLTLEPWWPEDLARTGARAAAACVIDTLIEHARGRDACRALDASRGQSEQS